MGHDCRRVCSHRRHDATRQFRRVGVGGVYWTLDYFWISNTARPMVISTNFYFIRFLLRSQHAIQRVVIFVCNV